MKIMASEIVINPVLVAKIQAYLSDPTYRETIENASSYNSRLSSERTMRLPFLDSQTGVAQNHSNLWMDSRQRLPGMKQGQVYTYPSRRWRKKRRQYLNSFMQPRYAPSNIRKEPEELETHSHPPPPIEIQAPGPSVVIGTPEEPKDNVKEDHGKQTANISQEWYYDYEDFPDAGEFDEPDADSDCDYEDSISKRKAKKKPVKTRPNTRGRRKITYDPLTDSEKPFACDLCGARYKTRPGLTYHYTHSHKDKEDEEEEEMMASASPKRDDSSGRRRPMSGPTTSLPPPVLLPQQMSGGTMQPPTLTPQQHPPSHLAPPIPPGAPPPHLHHPPPPHLLPQQHIPQQMPPQHQQQMQQQQQQQLQQQQQQQQQLPPQNMRPLEGRGNIHENKPRVQPSTYCDFCLGDAVENKKSGSPEELVSCSDCGRSGHPTCLQFTANMIISVKKYRWQCIECKCCSICGTSDNDDQLLFCDDCDRGYHMYCLAPPLETPPEGSWSCTLCLAEFHKK